MERVETEQSSEGAGAGRRPVDLAVTAFQAGEDPERHFRILYERFFPPLRRFFARKGLADDLCSDLTQETLLGVYRGLATYEPQARFETWLYRIATTTYLKALRSARAAKRDGEEIAADDAGPLESEREDPLEDALEAERRRSLRSALDDLAPQMRRCLALRLYQDLSYREIATVLGLSVETVKAHLYQARKRLAVSLDHLAPG